MRLKVYLAGPICDVKDNSYITWRKRLRKFLKELGLESLDPTDKYQGHVGDVKDKLDELRKAKRYKEVKEFMENFVLPSDRELVRRADMIVAYVPQYSVGTMREIALAYEWKKPIFVVTTIENPANSLIGMATEMFSSFEELQKYLTRIFRT